MSFMADAVNAVDLVLISIRSDYITLKRAVTLYRALDKNCP